MRLMYDAITPSNIPPAAQMVAGYVDGKYAWTAADWARFPRAVKVRIAVFSSTNDGHVLDVEPGCSTPASAPGWVAKRRKAGLDPSVYCSYGNKGQTWANLINEFHRQGIAEPHYWVAAYPGNGPNLYPGSVAHQYADPGPYDISVVADYWPGVDPTKEADMPLTPADAVLVARTVLGTEVGNSGQSVAVFLQRSGAVTPPLDPTAFAKAVAAAMPAEIQGTTASDPAVLETVIRKVFASLGKP